MKTVEQLDPPVDRLVEDAPWLFGEIEPSLIREVKIRFSHWDEDDRELKPIVAGTGEHATLTAVKKATDDAGESVRQLTALDYVEGDYPENYIRKMFGRLWMQKLLDRSLAAEGRAIYKYSLSAAGEQELEDLGPYGQGQQPAYR